MLKNLNIRYKILGGIGALLVVAALAATFWYLHVKTPEQKVSDNTNTEVLLGRWSVSNAPNSGSSDTDPYEYWGFVVSEDGTRSLRNYNEKGELLGISNWNPCVDTLACTFTTSSLSFPDYVDDTYIVLSAEPETIVVQELFSSGARGYQHILHRTKNAEEEKNTEFLLLPEARAHMCKEFAEGGSVEVGALFPVFCSVEIGHGVTLTVDYLSANTYLVKKSTQTIFTTEDVEGFAENFNTDGLLWASPLSFADDINFDGYKDLAVLVSAGAYNFNYNYYVFNPLSGKYVFEIGDLTNVYFNASDRTITTHNKGRGMGDMYVDETYQFTDGKYVLTEVASQDIDDYENPDSDYTLVIEKYKNGKVTSTKTVKVPHDEVFPEDAKSN